MRKRKSIDNKKKVCLKSNFTTYTPAVYLAKTTYHFFITLALESIVELFIGLNEHLVHVIGVNQYSNDIFGKDINGKLMMTNGHRLYEVVTPIETLQTIKAKSGFVEAKTFERKDLLNAKVTNVFIIDGVKYSGERKKVRF